MVRLVPALLAVVFLLSAPGVASLAGTPAATAQDDGTAEPSPPENTTSLLLLDDVQASNLTQPESNLATTLSMQGSEMDGEFEGRVVEQRLSNVEDEAKLRYALNETARLQALTDEMAATEEQARQAYINREISVAEFLRTLARLDSMARATRLPLQSLAEVYTSTNDQELNRELGIVRADIFSLEGPVKQQVSGVIEGSESSVPLYVAASTRGAVLASVVDGTYVREAYRSDYIALGTPRPGVSEASDRFSSNYPWVTGPERQNDPSLNSVGQSLWNIQVRHYHGQVSANYYGNATAPYREIQYKSLPDYPFNSTEETFSNDVVLTVNRTYAGGPMGVRLTNQTGTPLDGEVRINGSAVGSTGDDGTLWMLQPKGSFTVVAIHDGERITLELERATAEFVDAP